ncbi:MAG: hypothetical protein AB1421_07115 [Pseudomonadota bacterium]
MADDQKKPEAPTEHPAMGQIVGSLKDYPFLLITVAGLLILSGILIFDLEKLKEFKWLIYAVVLVPLGIQFLIEFKKMHALRPGSSPPVPAPVNTEAPSWMPPVPGVPPPGKKPWIGIALCMVLFGTLAAVPEAQTGDQSFIIGFLVVALVAAGVSLAGLWEVNRGLAGGKGTAITSVVLSLVLVLAALGWISDRPAPLGVPQTGQERADLVDLPTPGQESSSTGGFVSPPPLEPVPARPVPGTPALTGRYQLVAHVVDGDAVATGGGMEIRPGIEGRYDWQVQLAVPMFNGVQMLGYQGWFRQRGGAWFLRVTASNDPDWEDVGEVAMELHFDGRQAAFGYLYDGEQIQSGWVRVP